MHALVDFRKIVARAITGLHIVEHLNLIPLACNLTQKTYTERVYNTLLCNVAINFLKTTLIFGRNMVFCIKNCLQQLVLTCFKLEKNARFVPKFFFRQNKGLLPSNITGQIWVHILVPYSPLFTMPMIR